MGRADGPAVGHLRHGRAEQKAGGPTLTQPADWVGKGGAACCPGRVRPCMCLSLCLAGPVVWREGLVVAGSEAGVQPSARMLWGETPGETRVMNIEELIQSKDDAADASC